MNADIRRRYELAVPTAEAAARLALGHFDANVVVEWKADESPVTVADRQAERHLRDVLHAAFPTDGFLGEEYGDEPGSSGYRWVIDPIDATRNFVRGVPIWGTLVGLELDGRPVAGVAVAPALGHTWHALQGHGAFRGDRRIAVSETATLADSVVYFTSPSYFLKAGRPGLLSEVVHRTQTQRGLGDFYGFVLVAQGSGELMIDHGTHEWDVSAMRVIVEEAGGRFTTWTGEVRTDRPDVVASNGRVHDAILELLRSPVE